MTDNMKKFGELLSSDESVKNELESVIAGLSNNVNKSFTDATIKIAAQHGITLPEEDFREEKNELSMDEMQAVAGGSFCGGG